MLKIDIPKSDNLCLSLNPILNLPEAVVAVVVLVVVLDKVVVIVDVVVDVVAASILYTFTLLSGL